MEILILTGYSQKFQWGRCQYEGYQDGRDSVNRHIAVQLEPLLLYYACFELHESLQHQWVKYQSHYPKNEFIAVGRTAVQSLDELWKAFKVKWISSGFWKRRNLIWWDFWGGERSQNSLKKRKRFLTIIGSWTMFETLLDPKDDIFWREDIYIHRLETTWGILLCNNDF